MQFSLNFNRTLFLEKFENSPFISEGGRPAAASWLRLDFKPFWNFLNSSLAGRLERFQGRRPNGLSEQAVRPPGRKLRPAGQNSRLPLDLPDGAGGRFLKLRPLSAGKAGLNL
jgi:hypothetical protein